MQGCRVCIAQTRNFEIRECIRLTRASVAPRYRYDVAELYLKQADYDLDLAIEAYKADERWEKEHPLAAAKGKGKAGESSRRRRNFGGGLTGQLS